MWIFCLNNLLFAFVHREKQMGNNCQRKNLDAKITVLDHFLLLDPKNEFYNIF